MKITQTIVLENPKPLRPEEWGIWNWCGGFEEACGWTHWLGYAMPDAVRDKGFEYLRAKRFRYFTLRRNSEKIREYALFGSPDVELTQRGTCIGGTWFLLARWSDGELISEVALYDRARATFTRELSKSFTSELAGEMWAPLLVSAIYIVLSVFFVPRVATYSLLATHGLMDLLWLLRCCFEICTYRDQKRSALEFLNKA